MNLQRHVQHESQTVDGDASTSLLFRLVDVAARTLEEASPPEGHLARRYVPLLRGMTGIILSGKSQPNNTSTAADTQPLDLNGLPDQSQNLGEDLWEMWQQAGLESLVWPGFLDDVYEG